MGQTISFSSVVVLLLAGLIGTVSAAPLSVIMNKTYVLDPGNTTPVSIWIAAIVLGFILIVISFIKFQDGEEGLISIIAWIPLGFALVTSFAVDRITSIGYATDAAGTPILIETHTVTSFWQVALILFIILAFAVGNTWRIYANQATRAGFKPVED